MASNLPNNFQSLSVGGSLPSAGSNAGTIHKITGSESGYAVTVFEGKHDQMLKVCAHIEEKGFIPKELINNEVAWFYG